jgi:alkylation response protein AidB-like acyl-CoA dehydrogenase
MEFRLTSEQELFRRTVREWCEQNLAPRAAEIDAKEEGIPDENHPGVGRFGGVWHLHS